MTKIYLVRHGESVANTQSIYQGQTYDTPLSPLGRIQAEKLAKRLKQEHVGRAIVSPLRRTRETAGYVADICPLNIVIDRRVIETNHGEWEGKQNSFIKRTWPRIYDTWMSAPAKAMFPGGESFTDVQKRVLAWWEEAKLFEKDTLVVSHDNIVRILIADVLHIHINNIWKFQLQPAAITLMEVSGGQAKLVTLNDHNHLKGAEADLAIHAL